MASRRGSTENTFGNKSSTVAPRHLPVQAEVEEQVVKQREETKAAAEEIKKTIVKQAAKKDNSLDSMFTKKKSEKGKNKSIYFEKEVYDYCQQVADSYGASFNHVVNRLLRESMERHQK